MGKNKKNKQNRNNSKPETAWGNREETSLGTSLFDFIKSSPRLVYSALVFSVLYIVLTPLHNGYRYYLDRDFSPTFFGFFTRICGGLHPYDLIIPAIIMSCVCWFLWKRKIIKMPDQKSEDPFSDRMAVGTQIVLIFLAGMLVLPRSYYMAVFQINYMTAKPVGNELVKIKEVGREHILFAKKAISYFILEVDGGKSYKIPAKAEGIARYKQEHFEKVKVEWSEGCMGYKFISSLWLPNKLRTGGKKTDSFYKQILCQKADTVFKVCLSIDSSYMNPKVKQEVAKALFGIESDDVELAMWDYLHANGFIVTDTFITPNNSRFSSVPLHTSVDHYLFIYAKMVKSLKDDKRDYQIFRAEAYRQDEEDVNTICDRYFIYNVETDEIQPVNIPGQ